MSAQQISAANSDFHIEIVGEGEPVLFVHGFPLDHTMWRDQYVAIPGFQAIAPDLRGFGKSRGEVGEMLPLKRMAEDLAAILDALDVNQPITLCGLSMGGYIALEFWNRHANRLRQLILCDTRAAADSPETAKGRQIAAHKVLEEGSSSLTDAMLPKLFAAETMQNHPELVGRIKTVIDTSDSKTVAAALRGMAMRTDFSDRLAEINLPTLVICGSDDVITPAREMRQMSELMPASSYVEIQGAGHLAPLEKPAEVNVAIAEFLSR